MADYTDRVLTFPALTPYLLGLSTTITMGLIVGQLLFMSDPLPANIYPFERDGWRFFEGRGFDLFAALGLNFVSAVAITVCIPQKRTKFLPTSWRLRPAVLTFMVLSFFWIGVLALETATYFRHNIFGGVIYCNRVVDADREVQTLCHVVKVHTAWYALLFVDGAITLRITTELRRLAFKSAEWSRVPQQDEGLELALDPIH